MNSVVELYEGQPRWKRWLTAAQSLRLRMPVMAHRLGKNCDLFSLASGPCKQLPHALLRADIIHLHWVTSMIDLEHFLNLVPPTTPIVWSLHDMNLMTGGCHYSGPCVKFRTGCGSCPELSSTSPTDLAFQNFERKKQIFDRLPRDRMTIVCPSRWMESEVASSLLLRRFNCHRIPYGIDTEQFRPDDQQVFRQANRIKSDSPVVLFVSGKLDNFRKGFDLLLEAFLREKLSGNVVLVAVGSKTGHLQEKLHGVRVIEMGLVTDPVVMAQIYSAADVFVIPSRQDNLPNTVLEAMACGTAVLGFDVGGIPDMVQDGRTGRIVSPQSPEAISEAIRSLVSKPSNCRRMGEFARQFIVEEFSLQQQASQSLRLYRSILSRDNPTTARLSSDRASRSTLN